MCVFKNTERFKKGTIAEELFNEIYSKIPHFAGAKYYTKGVGNTDDPHPIDGFMIRHGDKEPILFELKARERLGMLPELSYTYAEYMQYKKYDKLLIINFSGISGLMHGCYFSDLIAPFKCELTGKEYPRCIDNYTRRSFKLSYLDEYVKTNDPRGIQMQCLICKTSTIY